MKYDYLVIGAGILGSASAYYIKRREPNAKVLLVDQFEKIGKGNTARSAALYRNLFSSQTSRILAENSVHYYKSLPNRGKTDERGYFWLLSEKKWNRIKQILDGWNFNSMGIEIFDQPQINTYFSIQNPNSSLYDPIFKAVFGKYCGALSAPFLNKHYANEFQKLGGNILLNSHITRLHLTHEQDFFPPWQEIELASIQDSSGTNYSAHKYLFATGAWTSQILTPIGIAPNIYPKKRQLFSLKLPNFQQYSSKPTPPILILPQGGIYIKPIEQANMITVGCADNLGNPFQMTDFPPEASEDYFEHVIRPILTQYFPQLSNARLFSKWAGYYAYHWPDANPVVESVANITWVSGTSGSGIMKGDSIGRIAAAKVCGQNEARLSSGQVFTVSDLSLRERKVEMEQLIL